MPGKELRRTQHRFPPFEKAIIVSRALGCHMNLDNKAKPSQEKARQSKSDFCPKITFRFFSNKSALFVQNTVKSQIVVQK